MMFGVFRTKKVNFCRVSQNEDAESLVSDALSEKHEISSRKFAIHVYGLLIVTTTSAIATIIGIWIGSRWFTHVDTICTKLVSQPSPLLHDIEIQYESVQFNGSLLQENIFRQDAGPEVDAAWESLGVDFRSAIIPAELGVQAGLTQDHVQVQDKYGGGFPANVEGLHHLHCLNLLRQSLYYNFDHYHTAGKGAFKNSDTILRYHVSHCLDILRQQLMCTVDIGVLGQVWWNRDTPMAYPDFNTVHKCRNFDRVREWAREHQAPDEPPRDYLKPPSGPEHVYEAIP